MAGNGDTLSDGWILIDRVILTFSNQNAAMGFDMPQQVTAFHDVATPTVVEIYCPACNTK